MDQLLEQLQQRVGLSPDKAQQALDVFTEFLGKYMSEDQLKSLVQQVPGMDKYADKLPEGIMHKVGDFLHGFGKKTAD